ncbi:MAG: right-handed parallel beta-helix repeat-containing protein [Pirellulales bacterium]|nr:right-handed parallel beta-helix repeat-containing protein [Pirellulales bacterium]
MSLREAIFATNIVPGADEIVFDFGHDGPAMIQLEHGELEITEALAITGDGPELLTIDAQQNSRIFNITADAGNFTITGMTLTGGKTTGDNAESETTHSGGAIRSLTAGSLAIENCNISGNSTTGMRADGGGIFAVGAVTVTSSTISGNSADERGGGIFGLGFVKVTLSTISGNSAKYGGGGIAGDNVTVTSSTVSENSASGQGSFSSGPYGGFGGGISGSTVTVTSSTISGNSAVGIYYQYYDFSYLSGGDGGAISGRNVTVTNSTISGNSAGIGGGINNLGRLTVTSSTISGNSAYNSGGIFNGMFDDPWNPWNVIPEPWTMTNSIISLNIATNYPDYCGALTPESINNLVGVDPLFVRNPTSGDPEDLHLLPGSPAINKGSNALRNESTRKLSTTTLRSWPNTG